MNASEAMVLVTGGARRIGASLSRGFHARGASVLIHYRHSAAEAEALASELNALRRDSARALQADLGDREAVQRLASGCLDSFGRLDILVNNASSFYPTSLDEATQGQWDDLIDSNLRGAFFLSQALSAELRVRRGSIVNIVDTHADRPLAGHPIYNIAKAGLKAMTRTLALELAPDVRVNGVSPGAILWPPALQDSDDQETQAEIERQRRDIIEAIPLRALGSPELIAAAACFLAFDAGYMTGQVIRVDGGRAL